jgi:acyl-coenzyme A thioesterase PaaI-like protein
MTDLPSHLTSVPARLGATALVDERGLVVELVPQAQEQHHGILRLSVLTFLVDVSAGVTLDTDPDAWTFTTDLSLRMRPVPAPGRVSASTTLLRQGRRSAHGLVHVVDGAGAEVAAGAIGFAHVPRKPGDPPKPMATPHSVAERFSDAVRLDSPLRDEAGVRVLDPAAGVVEITVTPEVCNPAGTLQGAMVALVAEAASEDLLGSTGRPVVVTDLDLRYLGQATVGPVRSRCRLLGDDIGSCPPVQVELVDLATDRITTLAYARAVPVGAALQG